MAHPELSNQEYLDRFLDGSMATAPVLLPHEVTLVDRSVRRQREVYDGVIVDKQSVSGGDDWHDGAFRETDREAMVVNANMRALSPYIGAAVIDYPETTEERASLGSRVQVVLNKYQFYVDIIGFMAGHPKGVTDPETGDDIDGTSPQMPLGGALLGKRAGDTVSFHHDGKTLEVAVTSINQQAVRELFTHAQVTVEPVVAQETEEE